jgi:NAD(P)H dehydrogenase (quinone)
MSGQKIVTGANGRLGRAVARALLQAGAARDVTLTSRDPASIADLAMLGFATAKADFADADSLAAAFAGATDVLMISVPGPIEKRIPLHSACIDAAKSAGVGRIVYTSRVYPADVSLYPFAAIHAFTERYLAASGMATTIARNNEYSENLLPAIAEAATTGRLVMPGVRGKVPHIAVADIAEILAKLLLEQGHEGRLYELNGPVALNRSEIADLIAAAAARPVVAGPATREEFGEIRRQQGRPPFMVEMAKGLCDAVDAGEFEHVWPDAEQLLGRRPRSLSDYIREIVKPD